MRRWMLLVVVVLIVVTLRCGSWNECTQNSDCDDGNPCPSEFCIEFYSPNTQSDGLCEPRGTSTYWCEYFGVENGTPCNVGEETGECWARVCRTDLEASDGGVSDVGAFEVQP